MVGWFNGPLVLLTVLLLGAGVCSAAERAGAGSGMTSIEKPLKVTVVDKKGNTKPGASKDMNKMNDFSKRLDDEVRDISTKKLSGVKLKGSGEIDRVGRATYKANIKRRGIEKK
jgi:hypothetical protein